MRKKINKLLMLTLLLFTIALLWSLRVGAEAVSVSTFDELSNAVESASNGDVIKLAANITAEDALTVTSAITIDGAEHMLSVTGAKAFTVSADLTLQSITISGNGSCRLLNVPAGASPTLTFGDGTVLIAGAELPLYSEGSPSIVINGNKAANGVSFSGNHAMYFVGGAPQITVGGKATFDTLKCGIYAKDTDGATITVSGSDVSIEGGETGIYVENSSTPTIPTGLSLEGTLTMTMGKFGVEIKNNAAAQLTVDGNVTINANYCLVSSSRNAFHMTVKGNTVLKLNQNPIHFDHSSTLLNTVRVEGNAKLSGKQIITHGSPVALTVAGSAELDLTEIILNSNASSLTVTDNAKVTCSKNINFNPKAGQTQRFTASGNANITLKGALPSFGIHFTGDGNGSVLIADNASIISSVHTTVAQNAGTYTFEMTGGSLRSANHSCVWTGDAAVINVKIRGGSLLSDSNYTMELKGKAGSTFDIYGGSIITTKGQAAIEAKGSVVVNIWGGYFEGSQKCCARPCESATLNVYGGYFYYSGAETGDGSTVRAGIAADTLSPTVNLHGGTFISTATHGAVFNAIAPKGSFNIAENAVFNCQGGNAILIRSSGTSIFYEGSAHRYSTAAAPAMTYGAQIRLTEGSTGLRFSAEYPKAAVDYFTAMADEGNLTFGTLIIPTDYLGSIRHFTLQDLTAAGLTPLNLTANNGLIRNEDGSITTRAAITNIKPQNLARDFTAIGYVCYEKDGTLVYFYANHREIDHSRSISRVAQFALEDTSEVKGGKYLYAVGDGTYSRYSKTQRTYMTEHFYDPATANKQTVDLYLIAGQSNAAGYSYFNNSFLQSAPVYGTGYENVLYSGSAVGMVTNVPLSPNAFDVTRVRPGLGQLDTYIGPELGIADLLSQYYTDPDRKAGIIKYAVGSSRLHDDVTGVSALGGNWYPPSMIAQNGAASEKLTGNLYRLFMEQVTGSIRDFRALGYEVSIKGVYWMQGESDRGYEDIYPDLLRALITDMRSDLGALSGEDLSDMPFVIGEISSSFFRDRNDSNATFVAMQQQLPTLLSDLGNVHVINSSPLSTGTNSGDAGHWTAEDMLLVGQMAGAALAKAVLNVSPDDPTTVGTPVAEVFDAAGNSLGIYSHLAYAVNSAPAGATVKLLRDLTLHSALNISNGNAIILDGNGHTLTSRSDDHAVRIVGGDVTMHDMRVVHTSTSGPVYGFYLYDGAKLTFNSGYIEVQEYAFCLNQADVVLNINSGTIKTRAGLNETVCAVVIGKALTVNISGGSFDVAGSASCVGIREGSNATVNISGGNFKTANGKYCIYNPDTGSTVHITGEPAFTGATVSNVLNNGLGDQG